MFDFHCSRACLLLFDAGGISFTSAHGTLWTLMLTDKTDLRLVFLITTGRVNKKKYRSSNYNQSYTCSRLAQGSLAAIPVYGFSRDCPDFLTPLALASVTTTWVIETKRAQF